jgi:phosphoribosylamine--glycine ligase
VEAVARGGAPTPLRIADGRFAVTTVLAAEGYPDRPRKGAEITIPDVVDDGVVIFHAGTTRDDAGVLRANGGRVLSVTAVAPSFAEAQAKSRAAAEAVRFDGKVFRRDIGWREAARVEA